MGRQPVPENLRRRTAQACSNCRKSKTRCTGRPTCNRCFAQKVVCQFPDPKKVANRQRSESVIGPQGAVTPHHHHRPHPTHPPTPNTSVISPDMAGDTALTHSILTYPNQRLEQRNAATAVDFKLISSRNGSRSTINAEDEYMEESQIERGSTEEPSSAHSTGRVICSVYIGGSAALSFLEVVRNVDRQSFGPSDFTEERNPERDYFLEDNINNTNSFTGRQQVMLLLLPKENGDYLRDIYFQQVNSIFPILDLNGFNQRYGTQPGIGNATSPEFSASVTLMIAAALLWKPPHSQANLEKNRTEAEAFAMAAKPLVDSNTQTHGIWLVRSLTLFSFYMLNTGRWSSASEYLGRASRCAQTISLHRCETHGAYAGEGEDERSRLWKTIFILDRFVSSALGCPKLIHEKDCSHAVDHNDRNLDALFGIHQIIGQTLDKLYRSSVLSATATDTILTILRRLEHWRSNLPAQLQEERAFDAGAEHMRILQPHLSYQYAISLATRPLLVQDVKALLSEGAAMSISEVNVPQYSQRCFSSAIKLLDLLERSKQRMPLTRSNAFISYYVFHSSLIVLYYCLAFEKSGAIPEQLKTAMQILEDCGTVDNIATENLRIVRKFEARVQEVLEVLNQRASAAHDFQQTLLDEVDFYVSAMDTAAFDPTTMNNPATHHPQTINEQTVAGPSSWQTNLEIPESN